MGSSQHGYGYNFVKHIETCTAPNERAYKILIASFCALATILAQRLGAR